MTIHQDNLKNITPIVVVDFYNQNDDVLADKTFCIMATIDNDSVNISPIVVAEIPKQIDNTFADTMHCMVTAIENDLVNISPIIVEDIYDQIAAALADKGYYIVPELLPEAITASLYQRVTHLNADDFYTAGIGRKQAFQLNQQIRNDKTHWLSNENTIDTHYLDWMANLRTELNQRLYMGLFKYEAHYAHYMPGAFYQRHVDAFKGESNRVLTTVLYLNPDWQTTDGGELVIYHPETEEIIEEISPEYGKFIIFLSDQFPHQVLRANRDRYSISGWFHINN